MSVKPNVLDILETLSKKQVINIQNPDVTCFNGTTDEYAYTVSQFGLPKYIIKMGATSQIINLERFFKRYPRVQLFPHYLYSNSEKGYIVYSYIKGTTHFNRGSKLNWMNTLVNELFNKYEKCDSTSDWGRIGLPRNTWKEFNHISVDQAFKNMEDLLPKEDYLTVKSFINKAREDEEYEKYLLHGDAGVHNFVFDQKNIRGVIDPAPMVGPIIYDFTYAFCSSLDDLNLETLLDSYSKLHHVNLDKQRLIEEVFIQLYTRIGVCVKVHPHDLEDYLRAWDYWRNLIMERRAQGIER